MYSTKRNVLQLVALLKAYGIRHVVISPGSRNSPLTETLVNDPFFCCRSVVDERSAAFFALGIIQATGEPAAACCTSGTAVLNYAPAVAEAFYQQLPLLVVTADRPESWIDQMAGQTIPQPGVYGKMVRKSVQLPEIRDDADEWYCNRLINEALLELVHHVNGPVQINVPISEPLSEYTVKALPAVRKINRLRLPGSIDASSCVKPLLGYTRKMLLVGQLQPDSAISEALDTFSRRTGTVILAENLSNIHADGVIRRFDDILEKIPAEKHSAYSPELLITMGGHLVSRNIWQMIRQNPPLAHWHISAQGDVIDLSRHLTEVIECAPLTFINSLNSSISAAPDRSFQDLWKAAAQPFSAPDELGRYAEKQAVGLLLRQLPENSSLHLGNSSAIRYAQLFPLSSGIRVHANRGTSGIDGCLSTAAGYATVHSALTFLVIGDLAFFFDMNVLRHLREVNNLRILLLNNHRGDIFYKIDGTKHTRSLAEYVAASHCSDAKNWAEDTGFHYLSARNEDELTRHMELFTSTSNQHAIVFEVFTDIV